MDQQLVKFTVFVYSYLMSDVHSAGSDYIAVEKILSLPVGSKSGNKVCIDVPIIDDTTVEETEEFVIHLLVHDLNVDVPIAYAYANVQIMDNDGTIYVLVEELSHK